MNFRKNNYKSKMKTNKYINTILAVAFSLAMQAQNIGINSTGATPRNCAMLDIVSSSTGLLIPNLALTATGTYAPATGTAVDGLLIYNTTAGITGTGAVGVGYYYWSTSLSRWVAFIDYASPSIPWFLLGNTGITTPATPATYGTSTIGAAENFLGTTDANDVVFGTNQIERMRLKQSTGYIGIGTAAPAVKLAVGGSGANIYNTDVWVDNNIHVQGNEALTQGGSRGRLRIGSAWGYSGLYAEGSSTGAVNDLILGSSNSLVRVGPAAGGQNLRVSGLESTGKRMVMADLNGQLFLGAGAQQGYGANIQSVKLTTT